MHPMERLRYVARAGAAGVADPAVVVAETVEALAGLRPNPSELVTVCRQLVHRNPACGPLWWLAARLLADGLDHLWDLAEEIEDDPTVERLAEALPDGATVVTIGFPDVAARALGRRPDVAVLAVDAGAGAPALVRVLERAGVDVTTIDPSAARVAAAGADLVIVDALACSDQRAIVPMGAGLLTSIAGSVATPRWLVTPLGTRLPRPFVDAGAAMAAPATAPSWQATVETVDVGPFDPHDRVAAPEGLVAMASDTLRPDCPSVPELLPPG